MTRRSAASFIEDYFERGDETAFVARRGLRVVRWSYARVATTAFQFARELERRGVARGDRVLLRAANSPEWVAVFFGCLLRGVIVVPLDAESAPDFVARVARQTEAKLLVEKSDGQSPPGVNAPRLAVETLGEMVARHHATPYPVGDVGEDDIAEIIYTSGTTAEPKGVVLTHRNLLANVAPLEREIGKYLRWERLVHPVRFLNLLPLSHVFGQFMGVFVPQLLGGEIFFQDSLNSSEVVKTIRAHRISVVVTVPRLLDALSEHVERSFVAPEESDSFRRELESAGGRHFLSRWWTFRRIHRQFGWKFWAFVCGGATLPAETEAFWQRLGFAVVQGYGMTETASLVSVNHPFKLGRGSIGKALPGREVKLGAGGEIMVRGDNVSPGYWGEEKRAADAPEREGGWLRTGDLGELDAEGNLYFKGRRKDVIVTAAGLNVYPQDLEAEINRQPSVRESCVVAAEGVRGPEPLAVLIMRDAQADPELAISRANERLASHQQIRRWFVWPDADFPRTPTQKVRKRDVAAAASELLKAQDARATRGRGDTETRRSGSFSPPRPLAPSPRPSSDSSIILDEIARIGGDAAGARSSPDSSADLTTDLKLDSLGRVELLSALEDRYQIEIDEAAFTEAATLGEVERIVHEGAAAVEAVPYPYPEWTQRRPATWARTVFFYCVLLPLTNVLGWARVYGKERLESLGRGPVLFVANHVSLADQSLILAALPRRFQTRTAIAMDGEMLRDWRRPPAGTNLFTRLRGLAQYVAVVLFFNVFSLPRRGGFRRSFAFAGETMDRGYSVLVFPEGRRSQEGRMNAFKPGIGILAAQLGVPVVPVKLGGLYELKARGRRGFAEPGRLSVTFGEPLRFAPGDDPARITKVLEERVSAL